MDCNSPSSSVHGISQTRLHLLHWQVDSLPLSHQGSPNQLYPNTNKEFFKKCGYWRHRASQVVLVVKNAPANAEDMRDVGSIPRLGRSPGEGNGNPLRYSCLGNRMDRGAWRATMVKSWTQLSDWVLTASWEAVMAAGEFPELWELWELMCEVISLRFRETRWCVGLQQHLRIREAWVQILGWRPIDYSEGRAWG